MFKKINTSFLIPLIGIIGIFLLIGGDITYADPLAPGTDAKTQDMLQGIVSGLNIILNILTIVVTPAIMFASWLMSPDWTSGDIFNLRPKMHELWITVSNITYFIYAILLIFIALATIFNNEHYGYKALLPKLALGIILVPMTWWFVQFIISLSTIVTASVINIPAEVLSNYEKGKSAVFWNTPSIPRNMAYKNGFVATDTNGVELNKIKDSNGKDSNKIDCNDGGNYASENCLSPQQIVQGAGGLYGNLLVYSFGVFKFQENKTIPTSGADLMKDIGQIINQGIIGAVMFLIYGILVIALIFMLITRAIKLWFYAIFSPLFTLRFVLKDDFKKAGDDDDMFSISEFIGLAFVPAVVGLTLSFGLVIVSSMLSPSEANKDQCTGTSTTCTINILGSGDNTITSKLIGTGPTQTSSTVITFGGISYTFVGNVSGSSNKTGIVSSALSTSGGIFGTIIIDIMALMFIWAAFMAGMKISKVASKAVDPFKKMGTKIGDFGAKLPTYAPIPGTGTSMAGLSKISDKLEQKFESAQQNKIASSKLGQLVGLDSAMAEELQTKLSNIVSSATENVTLKKEVVTGLQSESKNNQIKGVAALGNDSRTRYMEADGTSGKFKFKTGADTALFKANLKALGLDETQIKKIEEAMITGKFDENYLRTDVNGIAIFKRIMENQGSGKGGSTGASAGATNTVNNFNIASTTKAPNTITTTDASEIQIITNGIKNHFGSETTTKKDDLISKLKTSGLNDAVINTIITSLGGSYFK